MVVPQPTAAATESTDFEEPIARPKFGPVVLALIRAIAIVFIVLPVSLVYLNS
jgi:hypothetical protein